MTRQEMQMNHVHWNSVVIDPDMPDGGLEAVKREQLRPD